MLSNHAAGQTHCEDPDGKYLRVGTPHSLSQLLSSVVVIHVKMTVDSTVAKNDSGCVPIKLLMWKLSFRFHMILICYKMLFFF